MAQLDHILVLVPGGDLKTAALGTSASTAEIVVAVNKKFTITVTGDFHLKRGLAGMGAAANTDMLFLKGTYTVQSSIAWDRIRVFNPDASNTIDIHVMFPSNA